MKFYPEKYIGVLCNEDMLGGVWSEHAKTDVQKTVYLQRSDPRWFYLHVALIGHFPEKDMPEILKRAETDDCKELLIVGGELYVDIDQALDMGKHQSAEKQFSGMSQYYNYQVICILAKVISDLTSNDFINKLIKETKEGVNYMSLVDDNGERSIEVDTVKTPTKQSEN